MLSGLRRAVPIIYSAPAAASCAVAVVRPILSGTDISIYIPALRHLLRSASTLSGSGPGCRRDCTRPEDARRFRLSDDAGTAKATAMGSHGRPDAEVRILLSG